MIRNLLGVWHFDVSVYLTSWEMLLPGKEEGCCQLESTEQQPWNLREQDMSPRQCRCCQQRADRPRKMETDVELKVSHARCHCEVVFINEKLFGTESKENSRFMCKVQDIKILGASLIFLSALKLTYLPSGTLHSSWKSPLFH